MHWDCVRTSQGRRLKLDGKMINYAMPSQKEHIDMAAASICIPDTGATMFKARKACRHEMSDWALGIAKYLKQCCSVRAQMLSEDGVNLENMDFVTCCSWVESTRDSGLSSLHPESVFLTFWRCLKESESTH